MTSPPELSIPAHMIQDTAVSLPQFLPDTDDGCVTAPVAQQYNITHEDEKHDVWPEPWPSPLPWVDLDPLLRLGLWGRVAGRGVALWRVGGGCCSLGGAWRRHAGRGRDGRVCGLLVPLGFLEEEPQVAAPHTHVEKAEDLEIDN